MSGFIPFNMVRRIRTRQGRGGGKTLEGVMIRETESTSSPRVKRILSGGF